MANNEYTYPLVSVIIPGYNHASYLKRRIDSVMVQDYPNFEVIMLDDCSSDGSADIMLSYKKHERVTMIIVNDVNSGNTFMQWEKGISFAKGDYIWIAESDDVAQSDFLSKLMRRLLYTPEAALAYSWSTMIDGSDEPLNYSWDEVSRYKDDGIYDGKEFCLHRMVYKNLLYNASMIVFKKDLYYNIDKSFIQYRHSGDWLFWFNICVQGKVCEVPEKLNFFRQHSNKVSNEALGCEDLVEIVEIQQIIANSLSLSCYQRRCLRGRQTKRLRKSSYTDKVALRKKYPSIYGAKLIDYIIYSIDKLFNISGLQR